MLTPNGFRKKLEELMDKVANGEDASEVLDTLITSHDSVTSRANREFGDSDAWDETTLFAQNDDFKEKYEALKTTYRERFFSGKAKEPPEDLPPDDSVIKEEHLSDIISDFRK